MIIFRKFPIWMAASTAFYQSLNFFVDGISYVNELNKSLTEISIVTGQSQAQVAELGQEYQQLAHDMGVLTQEIASATTEFYRQGLTQEEVMQRVATTTQYAKISNLQFKQSAEILTATVNSMNVDIDRASDVFSYLGDATATGADEIGVAFQRVGGTAGAVGIEFEKAASWIAVLSSRTREGAATIGNSIKSILARVQSMRESGFVEEDGTSVNQVATALNAVGIQLMDAEGNFRDFGKVMDELGFAWKTLDNRTQAYLATTIAGTYQQSRFLNLMEGYSDTIPLYDQALQSAGVTQEKFGLYLEGTEAQLNRLKATWEGVWQSSFNSEAIRSVVGVLDLFAKGLKASIDTLGLFPTLLGVSTAAFLAFNNTTRTSVMQNGLLSTSLVRTGDSMKIASGASRVYQTSLYNMTLATRAASGAVTALGATIRTVGSFLSTVALPIAGIMLLGTAFGKVTEKIGEYKQKQAEIEKQNNDIRKSFTANSEEIKSLVSDYEVLNAKVESGAISESNDEYIQKSNRLAEIFPILTKSVDERGNATLRSVEAIKQEVQYAEQLRDNYNQIQIEKFEQSLDDQQKKFEGIVSEVERLKSALDSGYANYTNEADLAAQRELIQNERELQLMLSNSKEFVTEKANAFLEVSGAAQNLSAENRQLISDFIDEKVALADVTEEGFNFQEFLKNLVNDVTTFGEQLATVPEPLKDIFDTGDIEKMSDSQKGVLSSISESIRSGYDNWEQYRAVLEQAGFTSVQATEIINSLSNAQNANTEATADNTSAKWDNISATEILFGVTSDQLSQAQKAIQIVQLLSTVENLNANQKALLANATSFLSQMYPELSGAIAENIGYIQGEIEVMNILNGASGQNADVLMQNQIAATDTTIAAVNNRISAYRKEIDALLAVAQAQSAASDMNGEGTLQVPSGLQSASHALNNLIATRENLLAKQAAYGNYISGNFGTIGSPSSGGSGGSGGTGSSGQNDTAKALEDFQKQVVDIYKKSYEAQKDIALDAIEKEREAFEKAHKAKIDKLDEQQEKYEEVIKKQMELIDKEADEEDYNKRLQKEQQKLLDIQAEIDTLSLDTSFSAQKRRSELENQYTEQQEVISDMQGDKQREQRKDSLQTQLDNRNAYFEDQKELLQNQYDSTMENFDQRTTSTERYYDNLINNERKYAEVRNEIARKYYSDINTETTTFFNNLKNGMKIIGESVAVNLMDEINAIRKKAGLSPLAVPNVASMDTGGYTGNFKGGKFLLAHEKELMLNKSDTGNILKAVDLARNFMNNINIPKLPEITRSSTSAASNIYQMEFQIANFNGTEKDLNNLFDMANKRMISRGILPI